MAALAFISLARGITNDRSGRKPQWVRILSTVAFALLLTNFAMAQSYCDQVKQAVAPYGHAAAKQHATAHYSAREVHKCVGGGHRTKRRK